LVSHDRDLLNRVPTQILHLENTKLTLYPGNYDRFERTRRERLMLDEKMRGRQLAERARIQAFVDRFRYKASKARQAQSRIKMLERMEPIAEHSEEGTVSFAFPEPEELAPPIANFQDASVGYDGKPVLKRLELRLDPDDRIALVGANGNGKSTFIKLLAGRMETMGGRVVRSSKLRVGYFAQHQAEELDLAATPFIEMARKRPKDSETALRGHLGRFGFSQTRAETKVANLSGGEKARLLFALMCADKPQLLLLDEPTNHLDIASREALVQAINEFPGAIVIVSHDPHVVELTADRLWLVADGTVRPFDGDMDAYRTFTMTRGRGSKGSRDAAAGNGPQRTAAERRKARGPLKKQVDAAEAEVARLEKERLALQAALSKRYDAEAQKRLGLVEKSLAAAEAAWTQLMEEWEAA
jgi:ATP-binding cassette subfamily F protein 3